MEVEILQFSVPVEKNKTLFIWDIQPIFTEAFIYESLWEVFSSFGPLYLVRVFPNALLAQPGFYALVKFYSAAQASKALRSTDRQTLFQSTPLKVSLSTKKTPSHLSDAGDSKPLNHARCKELANHCLGFNGWSTRIITDKTHKAFVSSRFERVCELKELSSGPPEEEEEAQRSQEEEEERRRERTLRYGCLLHLSFPQHAVSTRGVAVVEETFTDTGPEVFVQKRGKLQKWVRDKALVQAFQNVLLIILGNGKVMVEVREERDQILPSEATEETIQVNEIWSEFDPEEEEWNLTVS